MPEEKQSIPVTRRTVLASATMVPLVALTGSGVAAAQSRTAPAKLILTAAQRKTLEAIVDRMVPKDDLGPGGVEMGAAEYIDRSLADALASERNAFTNGLSRTDQFALSSQGAVFASITSEKQDAVLTAMETGNAAGFSDAQSFFSRVLNLTQEGLFSDPYYGGNKNFAGWDLIRYPGVKMAAGIEDQKMSSPPTIVRRSMYEESGDNHGN